MNDNQNVVYPYSAIFSLKKEGFEICYNNDYAKWNSMLVTQSCSLFVTPWTAAHQAPLSMEFSRQEYWSGLPCPPPRDLPHLGIKPGSPALEADSLPSEPPGKRFKWNKLVTKRQVQLWARCLCNSEEMDWSWESLCAWCLGVRREFWVSPFLRFQNNLWQRGSALDSDITASPKAKTTMVSAPETRLGVRKETS